MLAIDVNRWQIWQCGCFQIAGFRVIGFITSVSDVRCQSAMHLQRQKLSLLKSFVDFLDVCEVLKRVVI